MSAANAIPAQGTTLTLGTTATAVTAFTAITKANPAVATKTSHGMTTGQVVVVSGATGMPEINNRVAVVRVLTANTLELGGIDSTGFATAATAATLTPTACKVGGLKTINPSADQATQIDVTDLDSTGKEQLTGLAGFAKLGCTLQRVFADIGQQAMAASKLTPGVNVALTMQHKGQTAVTTTGQCAQFDYTAGVDQVLDATASFNLAKEFA